MQAEGLVLQPAYRYHTTPAEPHRNTNMKHGMCVLIFLNKFHLTLHSTQEAFTHSINLKSLRKSSVIFEDRGSTVVKVLCYKSEGR